MDPPQKRMKKPSEKGSQQPVIGRKSGARSYSEENRNHLVLLARTMKPQGRDGWKVRVLVEGFDIV